MMEIESNCLKLTKTVVDKLEAVSGKDQTFYRDEQLKGFALRITSNGVKSFIVETRIHGKVKRITLGKYGKMTAEEARKQAKSLLGRIASGDDPIAERQTQLVQSMTLKQVFQDYLKARKDLKPRTLSEFIFPAKSKTGHIYEPKKAVRKVIELSGVSFTLHDLRRTFATTAESLDLPAYALKHLLNHKMNHDVTAGYIMHDVERLRKPMQQICDFLVRHMNEVVVNDGESCELKETIF